MKERQEHPQAYRGDIDGMRAIAVTSVVLFHLQAPHFRGGFVGVDMFFVISGFLIIGIIANAARAGDYSLTDFYVRRARRIFPALFAVLLFVLATMPFLLFPSEMRALVSSTIYTALFVSNFHFFSISSYFNEKLLTNPLLHTWSLAVEEQFYLIFPLAMMVMRERFSRFLKSIVVGTFVLSLAFCVWSSVHAPDVAFYLLPSRAWELMLGGILAVGAVPRLQKRWVAEALAAGGLAFVAYGIATTEKTNFPGTQALWPTLGAAALIYAGGMAGPAPLVSRILAAKPLRFVGLISYSMYLWHWPFIVISRDTYWPNGFGKLWLLVLIVATAYLSWRYVEMPVRNNARFRAPKFVFSASAAGMVSLVVIAVVALRVSENRWVLDDYTAKTLSYLDYETAPYFRTGSCFIVPGGPGSHDIDATTCLAGGGRPKTMLLVGDSHAAHLWFGLSKVATGYDVMQATATGCQPLVRTKGEPECVDVMRFIFQQYLAAHHPDVIVLSARWANDAIPRLRETIDYLSGRAGRVVIIGPMVEYNMALPRLMALEHLGVDGMVGNRMHTTALELDGRMKEAVPPTLKVQYVSMFDLLCNGINACLQHAEDGTPLEFDEDHLTGAGSLLVANKLMQSDVFAAAPVAGR